MIRLAKPCDAPSIARVHVVSWQTIYRGHLPDKYLDSLSVKKHSENWLNTVSKHPEGVAVFEDQSGVIGFAAVAPSRDDDAEPETGELMAIYLDPAHWRKGIGRTLMQWVLNSAQMRAWQRLTLWVLEENIQARSFYESLSWRADGRIKTDTIGEVEVTEVRYGVIL